MNEININQKLELHSMVGLSWSRKLSTSPLEYSCVKVESPSLVVHLKNGKEILGKANVDFSYFFSSENNRISKQNNELLDIALFNSYSEMIDILKKEMTIIEERINKRNFKDAIKNN